MKTPDLKFSQYPFIVPTQKRTENKCEKLIAELKECGSARTASIAIKHWNKFMDEFDTQCSIVYVLYSLDTSNVSYRRAQGKLDELRPIVIKYTNEYRKILVKAKYRKDLEKQYGKYLFQMYEASLKGFDERIVNDLVEENRLVTKYDEIMGGAQIKFRDQVLNLSQLGKYTQDKDRETRREAAIALDRWLGEHEADIGDIYDKLVKLRDQMAKKLGYKNYVELGYINLGRTDYNAKMVKAYREQIADAVLPVVDKINKKQMKRIGVKNPQYYDYSLMFLDGNPVPAGDSKYIVAQAKKM